jgi:uncharacterized protein with GYD domain
MAFFLLQVAYTSEATAALLRNPADRKAALAAPLAKLGGTMDHAWFAFGDYDIVGILNLPNNVSAAALALAVTAGGACKAVKTTPLMTIEEGIEAMKQAAACGYKPVTATATAGA